jgi:hypothetical protein
MPKPYLKSNALTDSEVLDLVIGSRDAQKLLKVSRERINDFCNDGRLAYKLLGRDCVIVKASVERLAKTKRPTGRPSKQPTKTKLKKTSRRRR